MVTRSVATHLNRLVRIIVGEPIQNLKVKSVVLYFNLNCSIKQLSSKFDFWNRLKIILVTSELSIGWERKFGYSQDEWVYIYWNMKDWSCYNKMEWLFLMINYSNLRQGTRMAYLMKQQNQHQNILPIKHYLNSINWAV